MCAWVSETHVGPSPHVALSATLHAAVLLFAFAAPRHRATRAEQIERMRPYVVALEARSRADARVASDDSGEGEGRAVNDADGDGTAGGGDRHEAREGATGASLSHEREPRRVSQRRRTPEPSGQWDGKANGASEFGIIGLLGRRGSMAILGAGERAIASNDPIAANGAMWSRVLGESPGAEGLGLTGTGVGGGGTGAGIGLDHVGDLGHTDGAKGAGTGGRGSPSTTTISGWALDGGWSGGVGHSMGRLVYRCSCGDGVVSGRLPPEAIQRIVRQNFGRFRLCYEQGLAKNPVLAGRIATRFVIDREGRVAESTNDGSDLPDANVVACVTRAFATLTYPKPEDATVTVVYPIQFTPD